MTNNLDLYNKVRQVPPEAKTKITGGRMNGKTNINAMWRIKVLTEMFGIAGIGWKVKTIKKWIEEGANGEKAAFVDIELYIKVDGEWSEAIEGSGGSSLVEKNTKGLYTSDECYKMAYTDALSVACKMIGIAADVYFEEDVNKYNKDDKNLNSDEQIAKKQVTEKQLKRLFALQKSAGVSEEQLKQYLAKNFKIDSRNKLSRLQYEKLCKDLEIQINKKEAV